VITYEYPLTERIRTFLRLESLFDRAQFFIGGTDPRVHHAALLTLFEILEVCGRSELKSELLQELERLRQSMLAYRSSPEIDQDALTRVLNRVQGAHNGLISLTSRIGQHLRDNERLMSIKQRTSIPGGACEFDLPAYHHWLHLPAEERKHDLRRWIGPLQPIQDGAGVALDLLRESGKSTPLVALQGSFQQMLAGRVLQMVRIRLDTEASIVPEISANRYALNVRFVQMTDEPRSRGVDHDVPFDLTFCSL
jgi:cell division protein ZapD